MKLKIIILILSFCMPIMVLAYKPIPFGVSQKETPPDTSINETTCQHRIARIIRYAQTYLGTPYVWGADGEDAFDCSGFVKFIYGHFNVDLPRHSKWQCEAGTPIFITEIKKGDLVFFISGTYPNRDISHVGMAITDYNDGNFKFIHACKGTGKVSINEYKESFYSHCYGGARRFNLCNFANSNP